MWHGTKCKYDLTVNLKIEIYCDKDCDIKNILSRIRPNDWYKNETNIKIYGLIIDIYIKLLLYLIYISMGLI